MNKYSRLLTIHM